MWEMIHNFWMERNEQLHKIDRIHKLHGKQQLLQAIRLEHDTGRGTLPVYMNGYFNVTLKRSLRKSNSRTISLVLCSQKIQRIDR